MTMSTVIAIVVVVVVALAAYAAWLRHRIVRLDARVRAARAGLDVQLDTRAAAARRYGARVPAEPGGESLAQAAEIAEAAPVDLREDAESALTRSLRAALAEAPDDEGTGQLRLAAERVLLARQFHNDAVHALRALRSRKAVRLLHVAPRGLDAAYFEIDDDVRPTEGYAR